MRCHSALGYYEKDEAGKLGKMRDYRAMLAVDRAFFLTVRYFVEATISEATLRAVGEKRRRTLVIPIAGKE